MTGPLYIGYHFEISPIDPGSEILIAELGFAGFDSFIETPKGVLAYIKKKDHYSSILEDIQILKNDQFSINYHTEEIKPQNWNAKWESNFKPINVDNRCYVRASFHSPGLVDFDIVIEPKMSFGTGHHETTYMMLEYILDSDFNNKTVLDMGCGTGVLAILSEKKGAVSIDAVDIDAWSYQNTLENVKGNSCHKIKVSMGDTNAIKSKKFDIVMANINRNVLLVDIPVYSACLNPKGFLFLSGFYKRDLPAIQEVCECLDLRKESHIIRNDWVAVKYKSN